MKTDFKVYKRKIDVYRKANKLDSPSIKWIYCWSTNAHKTCKDAVICASKLHPTAQFKAHFSK